jgi:hypothetical protein
MRLRYFLSVVEAWAPKNTTALIILGDSITDGRGSDDDKNNRFVFVLGSAHRVFAANIV